MKYNRISADCHLDMPWMPPTLFTSESSADLRDRMPYVEDGPDGPQWVTKAGANFGLLNGVGPGGAKLVAQRLQTLQAQGQVAAALARGDGVDFVDDHRARGSEHLPPGVGAEQHVERFRGGDLYGRRGLALRAGVLRRAVSSWVRPLLHHSTSSVSVGRMPFGPALVPLPASSCARGRPVRSPKGGWVCTLPPVRPNRSLNRTHCGVPPFGLENPSPNAATPQRSG